MRPILHIHRKPMGAQVSIERLFSHLRGELSSVEVRVHQSPYPSRGLLGRLRNLLAVRKAAKACLAHVTGDVHYLSLGLPRKSSILTIHDCAILHRLSGVRREILRLLWFAWPVARATAVTTISEATLRDLKSWVSSRHWHKLRVIPNCVDPDFQHTPKDWNAISPVFLQVGTGWNKNLDSVIEALQGLPCRLRIIGPINETQKKLLHDSRIDHECLGRVSDDELIHAYRDCDALIFVSLVEGFGLPILEAQMTGRPVITSDCSSMPEVAGDGALLVDPKQPTEIRRAVERMITDPTLRQQLIRRGTRNVSRFSAATIAAKYLELYQEIELGNASSTHSTAS
jgi:glycosyltransferase involved in cell wall biosynthesis